MRTVTMWKLQSRAQVTTSGSRFVLAKAEAHGIRLSATERALIMRDASALGGLDPCLGETPTELEWEKLVRERAQRQAERTLLLEYVGRVTEHGTHWGQWMLRQAGLLGVIFFSITGTHAAGEAGMHVLGATLVGCTTAMGGGTLSAPLPASSGAAITEPLTPGCAPRPTCACGERQTR